MGNIYSLHRGHVVWRMQVVAYAMSVVAYGIRH